MTPQTILIKFRTTISSLKTSLIIYKIEVYDRMASRHLRVTPDYKLCPLRRLHSTIRQFGNFRFVYEQGAPMFKRWLNGGTIKEFHIIQFPPSLWPNLDWLSGSMASTASHFVPLLYLHGCVLQLTKHRRHHRRIHRLVSFWFTMKAFKTVSSNQVIVIVPFWIANKIVIVIGVRYAANKKYVQQIFIDMFCVFQLTCETSYSVVLYVWWTDSDWPWYFAE